MQLSVKALGSFASAVGGKKPRSHWNVRNHIKQSLDLKIWVMCICKCKSFIFLLCLSKAEETLRPGYWGWKSGESQLQGILGGEGRIIQNTKFNAAPRLVEIGRKSPEEWEVRKGGNARTRTSSHRNGTVKAESLFVPALICNSPLLFSILAAEWWGLPSLIS